jgi:hypothetical protein
MAEKTLEMKQAEWDKKYKKYKDFRENYTYYDESITDADKIKFAEQASFEIEDLLSPENLMDSGKVKILQTKLNQYIHGEDKLAVDGRMGPETTKSIRQYQNEKRYWGGHSTIKINPLTTFRKYQFQDHPGHSLKHLSPEQRSARNDSLRREYRNRFKDDEDLREGGGDQGPY